MKKIVYIIFLVVCIMSCSGGYDMNRLIAGDSCQYWHVLTPDSEGKTKVFYYFDRKGKWITLVESYRDKKCRLPEEDDVVVTPIWSLVNDSVIRMGEFDRSIKVVNDTFIILIFEGLHHWVDTLYKVTDPQLLKKLKEVPIP